MASAPLPMRPAGLAGRLFGVVMERINAPAYRLAIAMLEPEPHQHVLEIGFGTGRLVEMLVERLPEGYVAGIDPTETMVQVARNRRSVRAAPKRVDLRLGKAAALDWPDASFDSVVALHCFQFWPDPGAGLREIRRVLRPGGRCVLILRTHDEHHPPAWLPNPLSRSGNEIGAARTCLSDAGFRLESNSPWPDHAILARRT